LLGPNNIGIQPGYYAIDNLRIGITYIGKVILIGNDTFRMEGTLTIPTQQIAKVISPTGGESY